MDPAEIWEGTIWNAVLTYIQLFEDIFKWIKDIFKSVKDIFNSFENIFKWYYL